jgi:hypothetical protein
MTHTLHRRGDRKSLENDYVILAMAARGFNVEGSAPKFKEILRIFAKYNPVNMGNMTVERPLCMARGASLQEIIEEASDKSIAHAVYTDKEVVKEVLKELKEADLGISIVVSGIFDEIFGLCKDASIEGPFTVNTSIGIMGRSERLPEEELLEIMTMCGHAMVSEHLTEEQIEKVKKGKITAEKAAGELARQCVCGIFNPARAAALINKYVLANK